MAGDGETRFGSADDNPLKMESSNIWNELIEAIDPASLLVVIERRMSERLKRADPAEDILQQALLHAWRSRTACEWRGIKRFRAWVLTIIDHRIRDAADRAGAAKRGGGREAAPFSALRATGPRATRESEYCGPIASTTPSRIAIYKEQAAAIRTTLESLDDDVRDIVRMRLLEQLSLEEIAERLELGVSAVRHRFRKGSETYRRRLMSELATRSFATHSEKAAD